MSCPASIDTSFGPWAGPICRGGLDFTLFFELVFFSLVPAAIFTTAALWECRPLQRKPELARQGTLRAIKLIVIAIIGGNAVAHLALTAVKNGPCNQLAIGSAGVECVAIVLIGVLSSYKHTYSPRPSLLITVYLSANILLNLATARTLWLMTGASALAIIYTVNMCCKAVCLLLENVDKRSLLVDSTRYSPEERAGPLSRIFFRWLIPLLLQGYGTMLSISSLTPLAADLKSDQLGKLERIMKQSGDISLIKRLGAWRTAVLIPIIPRLLLLGFTLAQPYLINVTVSYSSIPYEDRNIGQGELLIGAFGFTFVGYALSNSFYWHLVNRFMMIVRGSLISLIYNSTFRSTARLNDDTGSLTLMTVDVEKAMVGLEELHEIWASVVQIAIAVYVLATQMSWACVAPILVPIVCFSITVPIAGKVGIAQKNWNASVEQRVNLTAAVLGRLREVRILGIGSCASFLIHKLRVEEVQKSHRFRQLMTWILTLSQGTTALGPLATFALYVLVSLVTKDSRLLAAQAFTSLSLVNLIATPFSALMQALPTFVAGLSSLSRIDAYVAATRTGETAPRNGDSSDGISIEKSGQESSVRKSYEASQEGELHSLDPSSNEFKGMSIVVKQSAFGWAEGSETIKDVDFQVPEGSFTIVTGPVGAGKSTLLYGLLKEAPFSRGEVWIKDSQVSLCSQSPWLVSGSIRHNIVCGARFDESWYQEVISACALVEDFKNMSEGDLREVGNEGSNLSGGQRQRVVLARAVYARHKLVLLDEPMSGLDQGSSQHIVRHLFHSEGLLRQNNIAVVLFTSSLALVPHSDQVLIITPDGTVRRQESLDQNAYDSIMSVNGSKDTPQGRANKTDDEVTPSVGASNEALQLAEAKADLRRKTGDWKMYSFYARSTGRFHTVLFLFFCMVCAFCFQFSTIWVEWWSDATTSHNREARPVGYYLGIYAVLCCIALVSLGSAAWILVVIMVSRSGLRLHELVLRAVFKAPVSYFDTVDNGVTLNRFNQDMQLIDYNLPLASVNTVLFAWICIVQAIIISISTNYMAVAIPFCLIAIYFLQSFYLRTSRQLRLLDIEAKAPLYTNFKETIHGMPTIRAYGGDFGSFLENDHRRILNDSQQPIYLLYTVQRWLSLVLDLLVAGLATLLIVLTVKARLAGISGSAIGVALVNLTSFNQYLTNLIRFWASLETSLGAISRIKDFSQETPVAEGYVEGVSHCNGSPPLSVTDTGCRSSNHDIVFHDVTASYQHLSQNSSAETANEDQNHTDSDQALALSSINLKIPAGTKLAISGRSGSGKSTLVSVLFRILPISSGSIKVGNVDITKVDQDVVQDRLNAITQTSFFLPGLKMKENLDPAGLMSKDETKEDDEKRQGEIMKEVLSNLGIWSDVEARGGLDGVFVPGSWSTGQLQLLSLARSIVKGRRLKVNPESGWKVLVLDEATSNVDTATAALMQENIQREFSDYTILAIVHKFDGLVENFNQMIVLDKGKIVRHGSPDEILKTIYK